MPHRHVIEDEERLNGRARGAMNAPSGTVLYIEDNAVNALLLTELLKEWPAVRLVVAERGAEGVEQAGVLQPDLVLLDMHLPDMDGLKVLKLLQGDEATRHLKVVALSANVIERDIDAALRAGAFAYWTKPIDFKLFLNNMCALLKKP
jgi:CheY-like chemotaxis protein